MVRCNTCGGRYEPLQADGTKYFHACPPLSEAELTAAIAAGKVVLPVGQKVGDLLSTTTYERAGKRDENVPSTAAGDSGKLKAIGGGTTPIASPVPAVVVVP